VIRGWSGNGIKRAAPWKPGGLLSLGKAAGDEPCVTSARCKGSCGPRSGRSPSCSAVLGSAGPPGPAAPRASVYLGSAFGAGGIRGRVTRHLRRHKNPHWHLDRLRPSTDILAVWSTQDPQRRECSWSGVVRRNFGAEAAVCGLGSTDCRSCPTHFYRLSVRPSCAESRQAIRASIPGHAQVEEVVVVPEPKTRGLVRHAAEAHRSEGN
jgi:Uri superfamily endonuclease